MLPVYQCSHWSAWFFVVYLILGLYFFINMVVAVTYAEYQSNTQQQTMSRYQRMMLGLHNAFNKLTSTARARQRIRDQSGRLKQSSKTSARLRQSKSGRRVSLKLSYASAVQAHALLPPPGSMLR